MTPQYPPLHHFTSRWHLKCIQAVGAITPGESMIGALGEDPSPEHVDEFLSDFGGLINFSMTVH
jgi:hypothetical protein